MVSEKQAFVWQLRNRPGLYNEIMSNYCPSADLSFLSEIVECIILDQLLSFLKNKGIIPLACCAYQKFPSTETVVCMIYDDLFINSCLGSPYSGCLIFQLPLLQPIIKGCFVISSWQVFMILFCLYLNFFVRRFSGRHSWMISI